MTEHTRAHTNMDFKKIIACFSKFYIFIHLSPKSRPYWNYINIRIYEIPEKVDEEGIFLPSHESEKRQQSNSGMHYFIYAIFQFLLVFYKAASKEK